MTQLFSGDAYPVMHRRPFMWAALCATLGGAGCTQTAVGASVPGIWTDYKARFLKNDGRIVDNHDGIASHSEGQGYGMVFAVAFNDLDAFDLIWHWTAMTLRRSQDALFSWRYLADGAIRIPDHNNATDGDLLIALALTRAAEKWGRTDLKQHAKSIYASIREKLITQVSDKLVLLPALTGFLTPKNVTLNLSYYILPSLRTACRLDDDQTWSRVIQDGISLSRQSRFGRWSLPPDWLSIHPEDTRPSISDGKPPRFSYDAIRIPLYLKWGGALVGDFYHVFGTYWQAWAPGEMPAWVDLKTGEKSPYGAPAGFMAIGAACGFGGSIPQILGKDDDYYSSSLIILSHIVVTESVGLAPTLLHNSSIGRAETF